MPKPLLIGTANLDKKKELIALLAGLNWDVKSLADLHPVDAPEETGSTFEANALLKAQFYAAHFQLPCVADDSGLEVDALGGAPGVYSARYAGPGCTYDDNNEKLLDELAQAVWHERSARFVCCAAYAEPAGLSHVVRGTVEGHIATDCYGDDGFGYDPVFVPAGHEQTFAEMTATQKHALSHRGNAFRAMKAFLETVQ